MTLNEKNSYLSEQDTFETLREDRLVNLSELAELTGFPADFIRQELFLDGDQLTLSKLRLAMLKYLDATNDDFSQL